MKSHQNFSLLGEKSNTNVNLIYMTPSSQNHINAYQLTSEVNKWIDADCFHLSDDIDINERFIGELCIRDDETRRCTKLKIFDS